MMKKITELYNDERGQGMIELALLIVLVVLAVSPFLTDLGTATGTKVQGITTKVNGIIVP